MGETRAIPPPPLVDPESNLHPKRKGEVAELAFMRKAISLGYGVAKPWGDSDHYDFIINRGRVFWRIQVKSVWSTKSFWIKTSGSDDKTYTINDVDFLIAYIHAEDLWYVFPVAALTTRTVIVVWPFTKRSRFEVYREAWHLLSPAPRAADNASDALLNARLVPRIGTADSLP
jgi:hypothetical protein